MKKTITKKLVVSKATVRNLLTPELARVVGGLTPTDPRACTLSCHCTQTCTCEPV